MMGATRPYLSVVATARNDDHGGNMLERMQAFLDALKRQSNEHHLPTELIVVEWNPPSDKPRLKDALQWSDQSGYCSTRIIVVPQHIHNRYKHGRQLPLYQMIAKNVGIRRARGEFVLATNIDILLSESLFEYIAERKLEKGRMYRVDRHDVHGTFPFSASMDVQFAHCRNNTIRICRKCGIIYPATGTSLEIYPVGAEYSNEVKVLHTNACGDFTLLCGEDWRETMAYPEFDMFSFHLDSLFCQIAHHSGKQEVVLDYPMCIYHIEHREGWTPEVSLDRSLRKKLEGLQIPELSFEEFEQVCIGMEKNGAPFKFNSENWGLAEELLEEQTPCSSPQIAVSSRSHGACYLSIVVTARNDNHGGDMLQRMQAFVDSLVCQCRRFNLDAELVVVEWNPPGDKKRIHDEIVWPSSMEPLSVRFIEVPSDVHDALENAEKFPLFQMIAKNVGIRRASGTFVLATNIDIIFSNELMWFVSKKMLEERYFYRVDRYDIGKRTIPAGLTSDDLLTYCETNVVRINATDGTVDASSRSVAPCERSFTTLSMQDVSAFLNHECNHLHENGCGDFTLMSRKVWHQLKGYPELRKWSIYIDGVLIHMAYAAGLRQVILSHPMRIYHIEHDLGWAVTQETTRTRPSLDYQTDYIPWCQQMIKEMNPITTNDANWGFADREFPEKRIVRSPRSAMHDMFSLWLSTISVEFRWLYYRDQTPESLQMLVGLVEKYRPSRIVECGTLFGISLRTWLASDPSLKVTALDRSFRPLLESRKLIPLELDRVRLVESDILEVRNFGEVFDQSETTLLYVDAHDLPGVPIMEHLITAAFPQLPDGSVIVIDDIWYSPETVTSREMSESFFDRSVAGQIDPLQYCEFSYAPYWEGGSFMGFPEVLPLLNWVNRFRIPLQVTPGIKSVSFVYNRMTSVEPVQFPDSFFGKVERTPFSFRESGRTSLSGAQWKALGLVTDAIRIFVNDQPIEQAFQKFVEAFVLYPELPGMRYAIAVCLARLGKHEEAEVTLRDEIAFQGQDATKAASLLEAIASLRREQAVLKSTPSAALTIFAIPKAFKGHNAVIQRNAITSWTKLTPRPDIILLGQDEGTAEIANELGLTHIPEVVCNEFGTPLVNSIFELGERHSKTPWLAYLNADCLLLDDFNTATEVLARELSSHQITKFFLSSQRIELDVKGLINFESDNWQDEVRALVKSNGVPDNKAAIEMFFYSRGLYGEIPPFAIGRVVWDNWLVWAAEANGATMIDATTAFTIIHQCHDWSHIKGGWKQVWRGEETERNVALTQGRIKSLNHVTTHTLFPDGLKRYTMPGDASHIPLTNRRINRGMYELTSGNYEAALDYFSDAVMRGGPGVEAFLHYYRASCYDKLGRYPEALEAVEMELSIRPNNTEAQALHRKLRSTDGTQSDDLLRQARHLSSVGQATAPAAGEGQATPPGGQ